MKLSIICVVGEVNKTSEESSYLDLFDDSKIDVPSLESFHCLDGLRIRLLSSIIRRHSVTKDNYLTIAQQQAKYRKSSKLVAPRTSNNTSTKKSEKKNQRKRRNPLEIRSKAKTSKSSVIWDTLNKKQSIC